MAEVASAYVALLPSFRGGAGAISRELGGPLDQAGRDGGRRFGGGMRSGVAGMATRIFAPLAAAAAGVSLGAFFKDAIDQASGLSESVNALDVVFGDASEGVQQIGEAAARNLGLSNLDFNNLAVQFSNFAKVVAGPGGNVVRTIGDLTTRAADFASVMNIDVSEAATLFQSGLAGETEPLRRYGIDLSAATVQAYAYANGIAAQGEELSQAQKTQAAYGSLMAQTAQVQGDFSNTSDGFANQLRILGAQWADISGKIGVIFLPVITTAVAFINATVIPAINGMLDVFNTAGGGMAGIAAVWQNAVGQLGAWLTGGGVQSIVDGLVAGRERMVSLILDLVPQVVSSLAASLPGLVSWITGSLIPGLVDTIMQIVPVLTDAVPVLIAGIVEAAPLLLAAAVQVFGVLLDAAVAIVPPLVEALIGLLPEIVDALLGMVPDLIDAALGLFESLVDALVVIVPQVVTSLLAMLPRVVSTLLGMLPQIIQSALALFMGLVDGLMQALPQILDVLLGQVLPELITALLTMLPDIVIAAIDLFFGLAMGLVEALPGLIDTLVNVVLPNLLTTIVDMVPQLMDAGVQLFTALISALVEFTPQLLVMVVALIPQIAGALVSAAGQLLAAGGSLVGKIWEGIRTKWATVLTWFGGLGAGVMNALSGVGTAIKNAFRGAFNAVAGFWNDSLGSISFDIPDWVPGVGGRSWGFPQIPLLADGALATGPALATIGEAGKEAILPFSRTDEFAAMVSRHLIEDGGSAQAGAAPAFPSHVTLVDADGSILARARVVADDVYAGHARAAAGTRSTAGRTR